MAETLPLEVNLREGGPATEAELPHEVAEYLNQQKIADCVLLGDGRWLVTPRTKVGAINCNGITVRVAPKLDDINQLLFLLGFARNPGWRVGAVTFDHHSDFVTAVADAFATAAESALGRGLIQGYREVEDALPVLRGRLREQEQLRRQYGIAIPVLVRYDDYTVNIAENQIVHTAVDRLLRTPGLRDSTMRRLRKVRMNLAEVTVIHRGAMLPHWTPTRLNERYQPALHLAELVLADASFSHRSGRLKASGFMVEMSKVFEDFLGVALTQALETFGGRCKTQYSMFLDEGREVRIAPDMVWLANAVRPSAVIDAKYKAEKPAGFPEADLYQMLGYCTALGLQSGHLVYAKGNETPRIHTVRNVGVRINCHALDLSVRPSALMQQVADLANLIGSDALVTSR